MLLLGTPALWWFSHGRPGLGGGRAGSAGATGATAWWWSAPLVTWLPWLRYDHRPIFSYYAIVIEPFLILGAVLLLGEILGRAGASARRRTLGATPPAWSSSLVMVNFAWFWPIYTDGLLTQSQWLQRIWFRRWI